MEREPILYILMRTDLQSMNPGKAMAQASHASNAAMKKGRRIGVSDEMVGLINQWEKSTSDGFGTVLVLAVDLSQLAEVMLNSHDKNVISGVVIDPTYPYSTTPEIAGLIGTSLDTLPRQVRSKEVSLWRSETTCGYVFGDKEEAKKLVGHLSLHP
jgi:peptidyl-tRNA hydrolase